MDPSQPPSIDGPLPDIRRLQRESSTQQSLTRWVAAGVVVLLVHAAVAWTILVRPTPEALPPEPPPAITIDLAELAVPVEEMPDDLVPGPMMTQADSTPATAVKPVEATEEAPLVSDAETAEAVDTVRPLADTEAAEPVEDTAMMVEDEAIEPLVEARTVQAEEIQPEAKPARRTPAKAAPPPAPRTTAPPKSQARKSTRSAAPAVGASRSPSISPARWRSRLMAHLNRHKRSPRGGGAGTATVRFTINRSGQVTSARLVRSSGNRTLDAAAVSLVRRASPVPRPPASMGGSITLSVPVRFRR